MAEYVNATTQTVQPNQDIVYNDVSVRGGCSMYHREGSGIVKVKGTGSQCRARYFVDFSGNIAVAAGGTAAPISIALAVDGEPIASSVGTVTPAAVGDFFNVSIFAEIEIPRCCCAPVSVRNINSEAIDVANANLRITRTA